MLIAGNIGFESYRSSIIADNYYSPINFYLRKQIGTLRHCSTDSTMQFLSGKYINTHVFVSQGYTLLVRQKHVTAKSILSFGKF